MPEIAKLPVAATFTPREIVSELDRYIVGQAGAKRAVAIALRNRWRSEVIVDARRQRAPSSRRTVGLRVDGDDRVPGRVQRVEGRDGEFRRAREDEPAGRDHVQVVRHGHGEREILLHQQHGDSLLAVDLLHALEDRVGNGRREAFHRFNIRPLHLL